MTSAIRFAAAHARVHALKSRLWTPLDRQLVIVGGMTPDGGVLAGTPRDVFPELARLYATYLRIYPSATGLFGALFRRHEVENLKLLWRAAVRGRIPPAQCWLPLAPLATVTFAARVVTPADLVQQLEATPYGRIARTLLRSHASDLPATEIGLDRWVWTAIVEEAAALPLREASTTRLVRAKAVERDAELLRRGALLGVEPDLIAKSTVVLSRECPIATLSAATAWREGDGPLARVLPPALTRLNTSPTGWDDVILGLRRARLRQCRRAFVGWPYSLTPAVATLLLFEEQAHAALSVTAARAHGRPDLLTFALAASALEP